MTNKAQDNAKDTGNTLLSSTGTVGVLTLLSRFLGLARDILIAQSFGASSNADAFFVAFKIPNFLRRLFGEGAFAQAFVPVLSEYKTNKTHTDVKALVDRVFGVLGSSALITSLLAIVFSPGLIWLFAPGFSNLDGQMSLASDLLSITFPYLFFISLVAAASSVLNTYGIFAPGAFSPIILNTCLIVSAVFVSKYLNEPVLALAGAVLISGLLQLLATLPFLKRIHLLPKPTWDLKHKGIRKILKLMIPALLGVSVSQINLLLDTVLASFLVSGSVSWLYFSDRLIELPLGVFGIAIATVILPQLSQAHHQENPNVFHATMDWSLRLIFLFGLPACLALIILAEPILVTLFNYGEFSHSDVIASSQSLRAYAGGLLPFMLIKVFAPGFYAQQDMKTPVKIAIVAMISNMVFNLMFVWPLAHTGLALATTLSAMVNAGLLYWYLSKNQIYAFHPSWLSYFAKLSLAAVGMSLALYFISPEKVDWFGFSIGERVIKLMINIASGILIYFGLLLLFGLRVKDFLGPNLAHKDK